MFPNNNSNNNNNDNHNNNHDDHSMTCRHSAAGTKGIDFLKNFFVSFL